MIQLTDINAILLVLAVLALAPFAAMIVTSYTKVVVVLGLLRNALGVQQVPPNMVLNGIAMIVTCYVMAPIGLVAMKKIENQVSPGQGTAMVLQSIDILREPFRDFLKKQTRPQEKAFFLRSAKAIWPKEASDLIGEDDFIVLAPAYALSELTDAFKIGFLLYITFSIIDIIIANVLMSMGLNQVNPVNIAIPFKLLLFVVMDGWSALIHGLVMTYH